MTNRVESKQLEILQKNMDIVRRCKVEVTYSESFDETSSIWCFDYHSHPDIEMIYFRAGNANIEVSSENITITPYDVIIYPVHALHKEALSPSTHQEVICLRLKLDEPISMSRPIHIKDRNQMLGILFRRINDDFHDECAPGKEVGLMEDYARLLLLLCISSHIESHTNNNFIDTILEFVTDHYYERISVPQLANLVHVSEGYLNKCFKKRTGVSIIKYVNLLRIEEAKHMLISTDMPIDQIAVAVGYNSPKYFCRVFKHCTAVAPSDFRKRRNENT